MKKTILLVFLLVAGCMPASQQEVRELSGIVSEIVPIVREEVAKANVNIEEVLTKVEVVNEKVATAETPVEALEKGWKASEPFNPYYGYGAAAIALLKLFSDNKKKKELENKYSAAKVGMDKFKNDNPEKAAELYADVGDARRAKKIA
jgi:hypothetical protein